MNETDMISDWLLKNKPTYVVPFATSKCPNAKFYKKVKYTKRKKKILNTLTYKQLLKV